MENNKNKVCPPSAFATNLSRYLERSGSTQRELAKAVGVSPSTVSDWKKGRAYPRMKKLQLIADFFGIDKSDLVEDVYLAKESVSEQEQELIDWFHKIPEEKRDAMLSLLRATLDIF